MKTMKVRELKQLVAGIPKLYDDCEVVVRVKDPKDDNDQCGGLFSVSIEEDHGGDGVFSLCLDASTEAK
jgi:hypothetical protein